MSCLRKETEMAVTAVDNKVNCLRKETEMAVAVLEPRLLKSDLLLQTQDAVLQTDERRSGLSQAPS